MQTSRTLLALILAFGVFVLAVGMLRGEKTIETYLRLRESMQTLERVTTALEKQNENLKLEITKIEQSPSYAQRVLRDKYHLMENGERIVFYAE